VNVYYSVKHDPLFILSLQRRKKIFGKFSGIVYLCPMRKMVYKFLDEYLGDEVTCIKRTSTSRYNYYNIFSKKNKSLILFFFAVRHKDGAIIIFRGDELNNTVNNTVSSFFDLDPKSGMSIIRDWFADKHDINKVKDLMKFVK
jgi:hypothetical protein